MRCLWRHNPQHLPALVSRSSVWRILQDIDLKPHTSAYGLNSHDEDFDATAHPICQRYAKALASYQQGRLVVCCDEKTGMQVLERTAPPNRPNRGGASDANMRTSATARVC